MIRVLKRFIAQDGGTNDEYVEISCLSSDTKPTSGIINGSIAQEVDTGKVYFYNEAANTWVEQFAFGGGSGGGTVEKFIVELTPTSPDYSGTTDKTCQEITDAYNEGKQIIFRLSAFPGFDVIDLYPTDIGVVDNLAFVQATVVYSDTLMLFTTINTAGTDNTYTVDAYPQST